MGGWANLRSDGWMDGRDGRMNREQEKSLKDNDPNKFVGIKKTVEVI